LLRLPAGFVPAICCRVFSRSAVCLLIMIAPRFALQCLQDGTIPSRHVPPCWTGTRWSASVACLSPHQWHRGEPSSSSRRARLYAAELYSLLDMSRVSPPAPLPHWSSRAFFIVAPHDIITFNTHHSFASALTVTNSVPTARNGYMADLPTFRCVMPAECNPLRDHAPGSTAIVVLYRVTSDASSKCRPCRR
jgi:hypothetical protein